MLTVAYVFSGLIILAVLYMAREIVFADNVTLGVKIFFSVMSVLAILIAIAFVRSVEQFLTAIAPGF